MNKVVLVGRLTRDPEVRYSQGDHATAVARYTVAVDRRFKRDGEPTHPCAYQQQRRGSVQRHCDIQRPAP